jgi:catechol-2,3-dioxygenase
MARVQLALNVDDIDHAISFYSKLFATTPAKVRPGYANFAVEDPPLKLVLIENPDHGGSLNHLGVEVESTSEVAAASSRLSEEGLATASEDQVACCYAVQDKVWVDDPDGATWEIYTVLADTVLADTEAAGMRETTRLTGGPTSGAADHADARCGPGRCDAEPSADVCCAR